MLSGIAEALEKSRPTVTDRRYSRCFQNRKTSSFPQTAPRLTNYGRTIRRASGPVVARPASRDRATAGAP